MPENLRLFLVGLSGEEAMELRRWFDEEDSPVYCIQQLLDKLTRRIQP
jgi:hypothetical protein